MSTVGSRLDEAFNWLVLILSIIASALSGFPELYPLSSPRAELALVRLLVFPVVILVFLWLLGLLARNLEFQVIMKSFSWILASIILTADLMLLLMAAIPLKGAGGPPTLLTHVISALFILSPLYFSLLFCLFAVRPRMRETYKDSRFLHSLPKQALLYISAVGSYLLAIGVVEEILIGVEIV